MKKGNLIGISGRIETGKYEDRDGKTVYTTEVMTEEVEFLESKGNTSAAAQATDRQPDLPEIGPDDLPW